MSSRLRAISTETEFEQLLDSSSMPVLVDVTATWCGPCQRLTPILEEFAASQNAVEVVTLDTDELRPLARRLGGTSIPRLYLFDRGRLQLEVAGVKDQAWIEDMVGGYPALGITRPDGPPLSPPTPARSISLPAPDVGSAKVFVVHGHDGTAAPPVPAPSTLELGPGSYVELALTAEAIDSGYVDQLDPTWFDAVTLVEGGQLTAPRLGELARLTSIRKLDSFFASLETDDLLVLKDLPRLRTLRLGIPVPLPENALPHVTDDNLWLSPGLKDARLTAGLPDCPIRQTSPSPASVSGRLTRRADGLLELTILLTLTNGWYAYPPGSQEGLPVSMTLTSPHQVVEPLAAESHDAHLQDRANLVAVLDGPDEVRLEVTLQACDGSVCHAPTTTRLVVPLSTRR